MGKMEEQIEKTKEKIIEALDKNGISNVNEAIKYLKNLDLDVFKNQFKWNVETKSGAIFHFTDDKELIEWAKEERDKIEEAENE